MSIERIILCCSNVGYSWYELTTDDSDDRLLPICRAGFTVFAGTGLDFDDCEEIDVIIEELNDFVWRTQLAELANDAFVEHHAHEVELEAMHRPLVLTVEEEGALRFNPLTILRAS